MKRGQSPSVSKNVNQVQNSKPSQSSAGQVVKKQSEYKNKYRELEQIGKGTSGTVFLVKSKQDKKFYISKKIILTNLNEQERQAVEQELILLKKLKHPHIVGYKENFVEPYFMIIIMEYCEQGDLSFHIKQKLKDNDHFPENIILNWFIQLTMALDFIHEKHVLHRDVKSSNIFLTSSGSIKLGDFGISKILYSTVDKAQTLIGTPYYLSPEVCENRPYTYQSDIWALGCVLFEMCALKHPFVSENLMTLVVKIIREPNPNIPNIYSSDLNCLVQILLAKKSESRPRTKQILSFPFVNEAMKDFISSKGLKDELKNLPIKKTQLHIKKEQKLNEEKEQHPNSIKQIQKKNSLQNQAHKQANIKAQPQQNIQKHQEQQKSVGSSKINRKNSNDIKKMEELIQKQMKEVQNEVQKKLIEIKGSNIKKPNSTNLQDQKSPSNPSLSKPSTASSQSSTAHQTPQRQNDQKIKQSPSRQMQPKIEEKQPKQSPQVTTKSKAETSNKQSPQSQVAQKQGQVPQNLGKNSSQGVLSNESKTSSRSKNSSKVIEEDDYDKKIQEMMSKVKQEYEQIKKQSPNSKKSPSVNNQKASSSAQQNSQKQNNLIQPQKASSNQNYQPTPTQLNQKQQGAANAQSQQRYNTNYSKNNDFDMTQIEEDIQIKNIPDNQVENIQININRQDNSKKQNFLLSQKVPNNSLLQDSNVSFNLSLTNDSVFNNTAFKSNLPKKQSTIITSGGKEQIIEEIIESEEAQEHENIKSQAPSDVSGYKNEFLNSEFTKLNQSDDASKYQTVISEHIQTQMMPTLIPSQNVFLKNQEEINEFQDDDLDLDSLPQREDYLDSDEDNEYEEDFEVSSEEGDSKNEKKENNDFRLTRKNLDKELDEVIEMYKSQLLNNSGPEEYNKFKHMLNMSEIAEASVEYSSGEVFKKMMIPAAQKQQKSNFTKK
ncbi:hypothetical protein ABPG72_004997 [Tetrahymena utriculariae]